MKRRSRGPDPLVDAVADNQALPARRLDDPDDADALRVAISLKGAQPGADLPTAEFLAKLRDTLADEGAGRRHVSRRAVLGTAAAVAAGAAVAGAAGVALDRGVLERTPSPRASTLEPVDGEWTKVATEGELTNGSPKQFASAALIGFVTATGDDVIAVSAACTHQGCILHANETAARFDCPCHRTAFGHDGHVLFSQLPTRPAPLTRLQLRRHNGDVEVWVPRPL